MVFAKLTKDDLIPEVEPRHELGSMHLFLNNVFDHYVKSYGEYFQSEMTKFEKKLDELRNDFVR